MEGKGERERRSGSAISNVSNEGYVVARRSTPAESEEDRENRKSKKKSAAQKIRQCPQDSTPSVSRDPARLVLSLLARGNGTRRGGKGGKSFGPASARGFI